MEMKTVPELLREAASTYEQRNAIYGDNYKHFGSVMVALFQGQCVFLDNTDDHNRFGVFTQIVSKLTRYAENFSSGGHDDSLLDMSVYCAMLRELDTELKQKNAQLREDL
jgi:hypothetical protein